MKRHVVALFSVALLTLIVAPSDAQADPYVGVDAGIGVPIPDNFVTEPSTGPAFGLRLGYALPIPVIYLAGEVQGSWQRFPDEADLDIWNGRAGFRVGIDAILGFKLYSHLGYSSLSGKGSDFTVDVDGLSWDAGLAIDFTLIPIVDVGVHAGYATIVNDEEGSDSPNWVDAGVHVEVSF